MKNNLMGKTAAVVLFAALMAGAQEPYLGQGQPQGPGEEDGPGRGVARISLLNGEVSTRRGDSGDVVAAGINTPLVVQDSLLTGPHSRAEIQFDYGNLMRVASDSEVRLAELEYQRYLIQVARGTTTFRVLRDYKADVEISTPVVSVRPTKRGVYRVSVRDDGTVEITVRSGEAEIFTMNGRERLRSGQTMLARGTPENPEFQVTQAFPVDAWDQWNQGRDHQLESSRSYSHVSQDIYGAEDLDQYGEWVNDPQYGSVWTPRVDPGWAPYQYGRWSWIDYYGWTWVSYDPWGWAPFHYGRWYYGARGWCWWPGAVGSRYWWRPALVGWVGFGGFGVGIGVGHVGWVPLAPHEPFHPWYGRGYYAGYRNNTVINNTVVNNVNITNVYRNARVNNGVTVVNSGDLASGRLNRVQLNQGELARASLVRGQVPVAPGRDSLRFSDRATPANVRQSGNAQFYSRRQPAAVDRVPFDQQRRGIESMAQRSGGNTAPAQGGFSRPADQPARGANQGGAGWRRMGDQPAAQGGGQQNVPSRGGSDPNSNGWRRFGEPRVDGGSGGGPVAPQRNSGSAAPSNADGNGWRRFGEPGSRGSTARSADVPSRQASPAPNVERQSRPDNNWRRFGDNPAPSRGPSGGNPSGGSDVRQAPPMRSMDRPAPRNDSPAPSRSVERPAPPLRNDSPAPRRQNFSDSGPVRVSPAIVHERQAPSPAPARDFRPSGGNGGGGSVQRGGGNGGGGGGNSHNGGGGGGGSRGGRGR